MDLAFLSDNPAMPTFQKLAVGQPLPDFLDRPLSETMIVHLPASGFIAVARHAGLQRFERRALRTGRWIAGVMPAGPHAAVLHLEFSLGGGTCCLWHDFVFSVETHRLVSGLDLGGEVGTPVLLTYAAVEATTGMVAAVRQALLPAGMEQVLRKEFVRQQANAVHYTSASKDVGAMAALARHRRLTRETCTAWEEMRDQPSTNFSKRQG